MMNKFIEMTKIVKQQLAEVGYDLSKNHYEYRFSSRMKKRLGHCERIGRDTYEIVINEDYFKQASDKIVINTIMHEHIHSIPGCMNHKEKFKMVGNIVNNRFGYNIQRCTNTQGEYDYSQAYKYKFICTECDASWRYIRRPKFAKNLSKCICPHCKTHTIKLA